MATARPHLGEEEHLLLQEVPSRGAGAVPADPLIYRFHELVQVYGTTWKELLQEEFGDGIMSAIDWRPPATEGFCRFERGIARVWLDGAVIGRLG